MEEITLQKKKRKKSGVSSERILDFLAAAFLTIGVIGALQSMTGLYAVLPSLAAGFIVILLEFLLLRDRKSLILGNSILACLVFLLAVLFHTMLGDGLKLICNQIFLMSEAQYAYIYDKFTILSPQAQYLRCLSYAFGLLTCAAAAFSAMAVMKKSRICLAILAVLWTGMESYFGVGPSHVWNVLLYGAMGFFGLRIAAAFGSGGSIHEKDAAKLQWKAYICIAVLVGVLAGAVVLLYPEENNALDLALTQRAKVLRNQFDEKAEQYDEAVSLKKQEIRQKQKEEEQVRQEKARDNQENKEDKENYKASQKNEAEEKSSLSDLDFRKIFKNIGIILAAGLFFLVLPVLVYTRKKEKEKRQISFKDPDCRQAVEAMFACMIMWMKAAGLKWEQGTAAAFAGRIGAMLTSKEQEEYLEMVELWQEARYSSREMTPGQRELMEQNLKLISGAIWEKAGFFRKQKIKWYYFL